MKEIVVVGSHKRKNKKNYKQSHFPPSKKTKRTIRVLGYINITDLVEESTVNQLLENLQNHRLVHLVCFDFQKDLRLFSIPVPRA